MTIAGVKAVITGGEHAGQVGVFIRFRAAAKMLFGMKPAYCVIFLGASGAVQVHPDNFHTVVSDVDIDALCEYDRMFGEGDEESGYPRVVDAETAAAWARAHGLGEA